MATGSGTRDSAAEPERSLPAGGLRHQALFYAGGADGFVRETMPFIASALAAQTPVLVAAGDPGVSALAQALGEEAARVRFADMRELGENPARAISLWCDFLDSAASGALGIGEPVRASRTRAELEECERNELLVNVAFAQRDLCLLCPYDVDGLDDEVIEAAQRSHTHIARGGASHVNDAFAKTVDGMDALAGQLPEPLGDVQEVIFAGADLGALRRLVERWAGAQTLDEEGTHELVLAVNELATNSVSYADGHGTLRLWREQDTLLCEVSDTGRISDPLAGRLRPDPKESSGRGLWLANQLCDLVQIRSGTAGTVVRVHKRLT
jgi:anti-sigma regulatory factor (Ser/Thr protein kinase)